MRTATEAGQTQANRRRLIVNADDFGLTSGVNRAIAELHNEGLLWSTTLMARAAATGEAVRIALDSAQLGVGCHVVLLNGTPMLPAERIPALVDRRTGLFFDKLTQFLPRLLAGAIPAAQIEAEATAQLANLQSHGLRLTHIDAHKHVHCLPQLLRPLLRAAKATGISAVRNPFEPEWSLRATPRTSPKRRLMIRLQRLLRPAFLRIVAQEGFVTTDGAIGIASTGRMDATLLAGLLANLPEGLWELVTHPGYNDADLAAAHTVLLRQREVERQALTALLQFPALALSSYQNLANS